MLFRATLILALSVSTFLGGVLGLGNGMVLVVHDDGHVGVEHAFTRHAHEHADEADHEPHDYGGNADHAALHAAMMLDMDTCPPRPGQQQSDQAVKHVMDLSVGAA